MFAYKSISLHGLGFIKIEINDRLQINCFNSALPRYRNFLTSYHNHRFGFRSTVLRGTQINIPVNVTIHPDGCYKEVKYLLCDRLAGGQRPVEYGTEKLKIVEQLPQIIKECESYIVTPYEFHRTALSDCITLLEKTEHGQHHSSGVILSEEAHEEDFDRFQYSESQLVEIFLAQFNA